MKARFLLLAASAVALLPSPAFAWGKTGHRVVAAIADTQLSGLARAQIQQLIAPLELVEPGLVYVPVWRPEGPDDVLLEEPQRSAGLAAVGRKR